MQEAKAVVETGKQQMEMLEQLRYRAPFRAFDPRSFPAYWTRARDPRGYLDAIGIEIIIDLLLNQYSPKQIATLLQINQYMLQKWIHLDAQREQEWNWALEVEGDNQMFEGRDLIDSAKPTTEHISKAAKQAEHRRYMAKGFGAGRWGNKVDINQKSEATINYNFNVALSAQDQMRVIEGEVKKVGKEEMVGLNLNELVGAGLTKIDLGVGTGVDTGDKYALSDEEARLIEQEESSEEN